MHQHINVFGGVVNDGGTDGQLLRRQWSICAVQVVIVMRNIHFELEKGELAAFVELYKFIFRDSLIDIIKNEFGCKEEYYFALQMWIKHFKGIICKEKKFAVELLSSLMIEGINWLISQSRGPEAEMLLEDCIYNYDTKAFFSSYYSEIRTCSIEPEVIYNDAPMIYCTNNALYLLNYYLNKGMDEKFRALMSKIEKDTQIIDFSHETNNDYNIQAMCEIQKYRFMKYRVDIGFSSSFDEYLNAMISTHNSEIENRIKELSRNSDFMEITFHIELLMEYIWQTRRWNEGKTICNDLNNIFSATENVNNSIVRKELEKNILTIKRCKNFFQFLEGEEYSESIENEPEGRGQPPSYIICNSDMFFLALNHDKWDRNIIINDKQMELKEYRCGGFKQEMFMPFRIGKN